MNNLSLSLIQTQGWTRSVPVVVTSLLAVLLIGVLSVGHSFYATYTLLLALLMLALAGSLLIWLVNNRERDLFEIILPLTALFMLHYPIRAIFLVGWPELANVPMNWPTESDSYIFQGLLISFIGFVFFYLGYFWRGKDRLYSLLPVLPFKKDPSRWLVIKTAFIYGVGVLSFVMLFRNGSALRFEWDAQQIGNSNIQLWNLLADFRNLGLVIACSLWRRGPVFRLMAGAFLMTNIVIGVLVGSKSDIFTSILVILIAFYYVNRIDKRRMIRASVTFMAVFVLVFFPLVQNYRQLYRQILGYHQSNPTIEDVISVANNSDEALAVTDVGSHVQETVASILNRAVWLNAIVMIRRWVPDYIDFQRGATFYPLLIGWIPRFLWPGKPILSQGSIMNNVIIGNNSQNNIGLTNIGEFYLNFGMFGVVFGMFLMGAVVRLIYLYTQHFSKIAMYRTLLYTAFYPTLLFSLQSSISPTMVGMVRTVLVVVTVCIFLSLGTSISARYDLAMVKSD